MEIQKPVSITAVAPLFAISWFLWFFTATGKCSCFVYCISELL